MSLPANEEQQRRLRIEGKTTPSNRQIEGSNTKPVKAKAKATTGKQKTRGDPDQFLEFNKESPFGDLEPSVKTEVKAETSSEPVVVKSEPLTDCLLYTSPSPRDS